LSKLLINQYLGDLDRLRRVSGANRESVVREAFKDLLKAWGRSRDLQFIPEHEFITPAKDRRYIDGALLHALRVPFGYWEAKDSSDDLDEEFAKKFRRGYLSPLFIDRPGLSDDLFPPDAENLGISFSGPGFRSGYCALAITVSIRTVDIVEAMRQTRR